MAYAAHRFGIPATIVMPKTAPIAKAKATEGYGATVVLAGDCYDDAYAKACEICEQEHATFLHPYNDPEVIAGQGTLGLEILGDLPTADIVIVPAGGGGLLAGVAACIKQINPCVQVIGVQAEGANAIAQSFHSHSYVQTDSVATIADGIAVKAPGDITVPLIQKYADDVVTVNDLEISEAVLLLMERCKQIVEPSGAAPVAAVLKGKVDVKGKNVVCLLSGGNIDVNILNRVITRGLVMSGRKANLTIALEDKPGQLQQVADIVSRCGSNVVSVLHDGSDPNMPISSCFLKLALETRDHAQIEQIRTELTKEGFQLVAERV